MVGVANNGCDSRESLSCEVGEGGEECWGGGEGEGVGMRGVARVESEVKPLPLSVQLVFSLSSV